MWFEHNSGSDVRCGGEGVIAQRRRLIGLRLSMRRSSAVCLAGMTELATSQLVTDQMSEQDDKCIQRENS